MKILITGANGFVGKNLIATLEAENDYQVYAFDKENSIEDLNNYTKDCDFVVHLAGVNRPKNSEEFYEGNANFTETLCNSLKHSNNKCPILVSSSIQAEFDNDYGKSKREGEQILFRYGEQEGVSIYIYRFANLFGKWCRPNYNSVIATWCNAIANHQDVVVNDPSKELTLCYIDDVVNEIVSAIDGKPYKDGVYCKVEKEYRATLGEISNFIKSFNESRKTLFLPDMSNELVKKLYSTYLSYLPKTEFSYPLKQNLDERGSFTEILKTNGFGQVSVNVSKSGIVKGNHWHHTKNEKFLVVSGEAKIQFRNICSNEVIEYIVNGENLEIVDIPTGYTHNIINIGECDLVTIMWANEIFDPNHPDTYREEV